MTKPRVFTIPASVPFLPTFVQALLDGALIPGFAPRADPLALAGATIYLPTQRAVRALPEAILDALGTEAALLPRIVPLGEEDEDAFAFAETEPADARSQPVARAERRLVLAQLVLKFAEATARAGLPLIANSAVAALQLADELARLFDDMTIAGVPFEALDAADLIPAHLDEYWQKSLEFLKIARAGWETHLADHGLADPAAHRDLLWSRQAERIATDGGGPVIAAGSTGTIPAVAGLIAAIAKRPNGAVVLPGLDQQLDEDSFALIESGDGLDPSPGHPQFGLKRLIARIGVRREEITRLGTTADGGREALLSEAFRPAATTDRWRERGEEFDALAARALESVTVIEAADSREEALALAVALRETLETPGASAALVTRDRALARRVAAELRRWGIEVDDSGGVGLGESDAGRLARLAVSAAAEEFAPVPLIALLRHPLAKIGFPARAVDALEISALRGPRPAPGPDGLRRTIADARRLAETKSLHPRDARVKLSRRDWESAMELADRIAGALGPLLELPRGKVLPFGDLIAGHGDVLANLGIELVAREPADIRALAQAFERFAGAADLAPPLSLTAYADAFPQLLAGEPMVRPPFDRGARIRILGPLEARLFDADRLLLGGLNEGTWPPETRSDAWLNRPLRKTFRLDLPERRIGLAAHDFVQALGAREVIISRAKRQNGVEMVASRFLQRLEAVAPEAARESARGRGQRYIDLARALEMAKPVPPADRPAPRPPANVRPDRLSVTEVETLVRDPYSIYARHVLRLDPLEEIDASPGAAERGTIVHEAFAAFAKAEPGKLPPDALEKLLAAGRMAFAEIDDYPSLRAVWWPRFVRAAEWLVSEEEELRAEVEHIFSETSGAIEFEAGGRRFRLAARADRIDRRADGSVAIIDYKTGTPPGLKETFIGLTPQLPLEAAIAIEGGFAGIENAVHIADILVVTLAGGHPPGTIRSFDPRKAPAQSRPPKSLKTCDDVASAARAGVERLIRSYASPDTPYLSIPRPKWRGRFGQYDHLARIKEWSVNEEEDE